MYLTKGNDEVENFDILSIHEEAGIIFMYWKPSFLPYSSSTSLMPLPLNLLMSINSLLPHHKVIIFPNPLSHMPNILRVQTYIGRWHILSNAISHPQAKLNATIFTNSGRSLIVAIFFIGAYLWSLSFRKEVFVYFKTKSKFNWFGVPSWTTLLLYAT